MVFLTLPDKHQDYILIINHNLPPHTSNDIKSKILTALYKTRKLPQLRKFFIFNNAH
jgi:hypothetical protein